MERDDNGLPIVPLKPQSIPGITHCLKCQKDFQTKDIIRLRICPKCTRQNDNTFQFEDRKVIESPLPRSDFDDPIP